MTVTYNLDVSKNSWNTFVKILFRWRGSIWKLIWMELFLWVIAYYCIMAFYRSDWFLTQEQKSDFERLSQHIRQRLDWVPLTFLLGFFVTMVVDRWRQIFLNMGWIENCAVTVSMVVRGSEESDGIARRSLIRYLCLAQVLVFRDISVKVRRRFPNLEAIVSAGYMEEHEKAMFDGISLNHNKHWVPINWATTLAFRLRDANKIKSEPALVAVLNEIKLFRTNLALLCNFDWVPVPVAYPQVVFLAVRVYFLLCLVGRQYIIGEGATNRSILDLYVPFMTLLQFIFYMGWMKVAESLLNPLGEDDDHFECNVLIDKNIATGLAIVDNQYDQLPELRMDRLGEKPKPLYTEETVPRERRESKFAGSAAHLILAKDDQAVPMVTIPEVEDEVLSTTSPILSSIRKRFSKRFNGQSKATPFTGRSASHVDLDSASRRIPRGGFNRTFNGRGLNEQMHFDSSFESHVSPFDHSINSSETPGHFNFGNSICHERGSTKLEKLERVDEEASSVSRESGEFVMDEPSRSPTSPTNISSPPPSFSAPFRVPSPPLSPVKGILKQGSIESCAHPK